MKEIHVKCKIQRFKTNFETRNGTKIAETFCLFLRSPITPKFDLIKKKSNSGIRHFHIAHFNTLCFTFLLGFPPREIENSDYAKLLGGKQSVLWAMWEWQIDKRKERV